ncbi:hypothetical protein CDAR_69881 [Caerostris darwini]|uniref:Uncharacterized protein n=1 Tax=Caerostris darwini TaxID=1538125 RepID=A0AAV4T502_9ARAC|nr:hypothetical protein CDAR_69881 [Caerostris darwini]
MKGPAENPPQTIFQSFSLLVENIRIIDVEKTLVFFIFPLPHTPTFLPIPQESVSIGGDEKDRPPISILSAVTQRMNSSQRRSVVKWSKDASFCCSSKRNLPANDAW